MRRVFFILVWAVNQLKTLYHLCKWKAILASLFYLPIILFRVSLSLLTLRLFLLLLNIGSTLFFHNLASPLLTPEALVFAASYTEATTTIGINMMAADDDLARAVAPFLPRGGEALPEQRPLTMDENSRLAVVINFQKEIGALLKTIDATAVWNHYLAEESAEDLAAATLLHKEDDLHDPKKLWLVREGLRLDQNSSRYYWRAVSWVRAERQVRNGDLPITFIIDDDGEG